MAIPTSAEHRTSIPSDAAIGTVRLTVADLARSRTFYERSVGLEASELEDGGLALGIPGEHPVIELHGDSSASELNQRTTGLYHLAILVPTRPDLALALARLAESGWPIDGASDHLVSEALYLSDPDGNGIEIYRDRPREQWPRTGDKLEMATLPLEINDLLGELRSADGPQLRVPAGTRIGHVHLRVADLKAAESFYHHVLGFDVTVRGYPGALFVSAGGYHHHIGLNIWQSAGSSPPTPGSVGLRSFEVTVPNEQALERTLDRVRAAGIEIEATPLGALIRDPSSIAVLLRAA